jgi:hypothetical protein
MADVKEILKQLVSHEAELIGQLEATQNAIIGFGGKPAAKLSKTAKEEAPKAEAAPKAPKAAKADSAALTKTGRLKREPKQIQLRGSYGETKTWNEKVLFVLKQHGPATADAITQTITGYEPGLDGDKLRAMIANTASQLTKKKAIKGVRDGRSTTYSL